MEKRWIVGKPVAVVHGVETRIFDVQAALDWMMDMIYTTDCRCFAINKALFCEGFNTLKTGLAGEILQKFINYEVKMAVYGDFSQNKSKALRDFFYECNRGKDFFFAENEEKAMEYLTKQGK